MLFYSDILYTVACWYTLDYAQNGGGVYFTAENHEWNFTLFIEKNKKQKTQNMRSSTEPRFPGNHPTEHAHVASPFSVKLWRAEAENTPQPGSDTFQDEHNDMKESTELKQKHEECWCSVEMYAVPSQTVMTTSLKQETELSKKRMGGTDEDEKNKQVWKLQSQALQSLKKAAVAIFPLPTKYSQTFVKLRIYCRFAAYRKPET